MSERTCSIAAEFNARVTPWTLIQQRGRTEILGRSHAGSCIAPVLCGMHPPVQVGAQLPHNTLRSPNPSPQRTGLLGPGQRGILEPLRRCVLRSMLVEFQEHRHMLPPDDAQPYGRRRSLYEESSRLGVGVAGRRDGEAGELVLPL